MARHVQPFEARFSPKVQKRDDGCWQWTGHIEKTGYGRIWYDGNYVGVHRAAYMHFVGDIPDGLVIDHLCRNRGCVNPEHMEPVTSGENVLRGIGITAVNKQKTHCVNGHALSGDNLIVRPDGGRKCRQCDRESDRRAYARRGPRTEYNETRTCVICDSPFEVYRHHPTTTCSKRCGTTLGWQKRRKAA